MLFFRLIFICPGCECRSLRPGWPRTANAYTPPPLPSICIDLEGLCPVSKIKDDVSEPLTGHSLYYGEYTRTPLNIFILVFT